MYYRSDWPEVGLPTALNEQGPVDLTDHLDNDHDWVQETRAFGAAFRWVADQGEFESNLYGFPVWNLHLEVNDANNHTLTARLNGATFREYVNEMVRQLLDAPPWSAAYATSKVVENGPLHEALLQVGFDKVESRRLYACQVRDITSMPPPSLVGNIRLASLATVAPEKLSSYRKQILDICREAFEKGHSRHFTDPVLLERLPGTAYILAAMELNFEHVVPSHFLVAVDIGSDQVCGFSAVGRKPGLKEDIFTQLLSAVRRAYRGRGIYRGLTHLLSQTLPQEATLLNVTHVGNRAIQRAYQGSGRVHLADTVVLRRVFRADG